MPQPLIRAAGFVIGGRFSDCQKWQSRSGNPPNESRCGLVVKYGEFPSLKSNSDVRHLRNLWLTGAGNNRPDPFFLNTHFSGDLKVSDLARLKTRANQPVVGYQLIIRKRQDYKGIYNLAAEKST